MLLTSPSFAHNQMIPVRYTCDGENEHPPLSIRDVPENTRSLAILMHDPDAVSGDFTHWLVWNIDPSIRDIPAGIVPEGCIEELNGKNMRGYTGPCPPEGTGIHHYHFILIALSMAPGASPGMNRDEFLKAIDGHELARTVLTGLYIRGGGDREPEWLTVPVTGSL